MGQRDTGTGHACSSLPSWGWGGRSGGWGRCSRARRGGVGRLGPCGRRCGGSGCCRYRWLWRDVLGAGSGVVADVAEDGGSGGANGVVGGGAVEELPGGDPAGPNAVPRSPCAAATPGSTDLHPLPQTTRPGHLCRQSPRLFGAMWASWPGPGNADAAREDRGTCGSRSSDARSFRSTRLQVVRNTVRLKAGREGLGVRGPAPAP